MSRSKKIMALFLSIVMVLGLLPASAFAANDTSAFSDVKTSAWYHEDVQYVSENGLMKGTGENLFSPDATTTRGMIVTILYRLEGEPSPIGACPFQDVASGKYYEKAITWAAENGIVSGFSADTFGPDQNITREQMAAILYRYATYKKYDVSTAGDLSKFPDADKVSSYAVDAMKWANAAGLINGSNDGKLYPAGNATRAQVAAILTRFCKNIAAQCTVTFQLNYGSEGTYTTLKVAKGDTITAPKAPTRSGYTFSSWSEKTSGSAFDFKTPIEKDITLYAQWNKKSSSGGNSSTVHYYTVTFDALARDATNVPESQQVRSGEVATEPGAPSRSGYIFNGWYVDSDCTEKYNFTTPVAKNITLYAGWHQNIDNLEDDKIDRGDIEDMLTSGKIDVNFDDYGNVRTIDGPFTYEKVNSKQDAVEVLNSMAPLFEDNIHANVEQIQEDSVGIQDEDKENFYRYSSIINGIPVIGSQIILSTDATGTVTGLFSSFNKDLGDVDTETSISTDIAKENALNAFLEEDEVNAYIKGLSENTANSEEAKQALIDNLSIESQLAIYAANDEQKPLLVYVVSISIPDSDEGIGDDEDTTFSVPEFSRTLYIYGNGELSGKIYLNIDNFTYSENGWNDICIKGTNFKGNLVDINAQVKNGTYRLKDSERGIKTVVDGKIASASSFADSNECTRAVVTLHSNMAKTYDYYKNVLGRKSVDGKGENLKFEYDKTYTNATCRKGSSIIKDRFKFGGTGRNYFAALDVAGHEYTHSVSGHILGRTLSIENLGKCGFISGAMDEAYADIMGAFVEGKTGDDFWRFGEDTGSSPIRDMSNPPVKQYNGLKEYDGRYIESGVYSFAVYKMMTDDRTSGITRDTWATVFYRSIYRMTNDAKFIDGRRAVILAAKTLGFTAEQQQAIKDAFDAVGITEPDSIRIVLTWGETPFDLDSHLVGPGINGGERFHTAFYQRTYYADGTYDSNSSKYVADLDYDDTTSYGPEVTTIHMLRPGEYYFFVHDYSNGSSATSTEMAHSGATVKVYRGSSGTPINTFNVDPSSSGTYWNVFKLTIGSGGTIEDITIDPINTYDAVETLS